MQARSLWADVEVLLGDAFKTSMCCIKLLKVVLNFFLFSNDRQQIIYFFEQI